MKKLLLLSFTIFSLFLITNIIPEQANGQDLESIMSDLEDMSNGGEIVYTEPVKAVIFSHRKHVIDLGLQCEWCHDETFQMEAGAMESSASVDMASLCNDQYCGTCHNGDVAFATTTQCARCHIGVKGYDKLVSEGTIEAVEKPQENPTKTSITQPSKAGE